MLFDLNSKKNFYFKHFNFLIVKFLKTKNNFLR